MQANSARDSGSLLSRGKVLSVEKPESASPTEKGKEVILWVTVQYCLHSLFNMLQYYMCKAVADANHLTVWPLKITQNVGNC